MWWVVPLLVAFLLLAVCALVPVSVTVRGYVTRTGTLLFGSYIRKRAEDGENEGVRERMNRLRAAHYAVTYRTYSVRTLMYATLFAVAGSILAVYVVWGGLLALNLSAEGARAALPAQLGFLGSFLVSPELSTGQLFVVLIASNATLGLVFGYIVYWARWWWPSYVGNEREREIDDSLQRTVAFMYALSRSGMSFPEVMRILANNQAVYGEAAAEVGVAVRDMDVFGTDMVEAIRRAARRTPSERMEEFLENLVSVLQSGRSIPSFLNDQYDYMEEENEAEQSQFLELLATLAEGYVTGLVAGPLFLITILVIIGLVIGGTLTFLQALVYLLLPLASFGFLVYLDSITGIADVEIDRAQEDSRAEQFNDIRRANRTPDGGVVGWFSDDAGNAARLSAHNRFRGLRRWAEHPLESIGRRPTAILYITVPSALAALSIRTWQLSQSGGLSLAAMDDAVVQATLLVIGTFAIPHEVNRRRVKALEATVPDFLSQLASVNEAGTSIVESIQKVSNNNLGALNEDLDRTWSDITWGARVENALWRFEERLDTPVVTRAVTLITNAMAASGDIGPVLRIAADEAQATRRLRRERRQELLTYVVVIYLSFFVFLTIIIALDVMFLPNIPTTSEFSGGAGAVSGMTGGIGGLGGLDASTKDAYELLFFHAALVQAVCSGFIAGQMGDSTIGGGAKHATAMLAIAYGLFVVLG